MLTFLSIRHLPFLPKIDVEFGEGLNVITGETGAGKSIVVDALSFLLGGRLRGAPAQAGGAPSVQGTFSVDDKALARALADLGAPPEEGEVTLRREIESEGKARCFVNGAKGPLHTLKAVATLLVDVHGQHENQSLFDPDEQLRLLDAFAGAGETLEAYRETFDRWQVAREKLAAVESEEKAALAQKEFLEFQRNELRQAELKEGREQSLLDEIRRSENREKIAELSAALEQAWGENLPREINAGQKALEGLAKFDSRLIPLLDRAEELSVRARELSARLPAAAGSGEESAAHLDALNATLALLNRLKRKYQRDEAGLIALLGEVESKLDRLNTAAFEKSDLEKEIQTLQKQLDKQGDALARLRRAAAKKFDGRVGELLKAMNMPEALFATRFEKRESPGPLGPDKTEYFIATLPGEPAKPLKQVASGGELSRVMLAVKAVLAAVDRMPVLVFDEVDTGIGGETAVKIGMTLKALSKHHQIFCVTHLHQIAGQAGRHYSVEKKGAAVALRRLDESERVAEVARMLGDAKSKSARDHAKSLVTGRA